MTAGRRRIYRGTILAGYPHRQPLTALSCVDGSDGDDSGHQWTPTAVANVACSVTPKRSSQPDNHQSDAHHQLPIVRRSYRTPEQLRSILASQQSFYAPSALRNPYIPHAFAITTTNYHQLNHGGISLTPAALSSTTAYNDNVTGDDVDVDRHDPARQHDDMTPVHVAAGTGDTEMLARCLDVFDIDSVDREGRTALMYAVIGERAAVIDLLIRRGAMQNVADHDGRTALHWAAFYGRNDIALQLVKHGANWRIRDNEGRTALHWATGNESTRCLEILLQQCTALEVNEPDMELMTPLHWACYHNNPKHVKLLLQHGARPLLTDVEGKTALHWSSSHRDTLCAQLLITENPSIIGVADLDGRTVLHLACGGNNFALASILTSSAECKMNAFDSTQRTPLHWAAVSGHHHLVTLILERGTADDARDSIGATPLHYACSKNHSQCVAAFLAFPDASYLPDNEGRHALIWAVTKGHVQTVGVVLERGMDATLADNTGSTALHMAANVGQTHCVTLLLKYNAVVDAVDQDQQTPLFRAVEKGYAETASMLIQAGANVNWEQADKRTPLHVAALFGQLPVLSLLLANGADYNHRDNLGMTAIHCGAYNGHNDVVKYLLECGADINCVDNENMTPCHLAAQQNHPHTLELLLVEGAKASPTCCCGDTLTPLDCALRLGNDACVSVLMQFKGKTLYNLRDYAAVTIQRVWRGFKLRSLVWSDIKAQRLIQRRLRKQAAIIIQRAYRRKMPRPLRRSSINDLPIAVPLITLNASLNTKTSTMDSDERLYFVDMATARLQESHLSELNSVQEGVVSGPQSERTQSEHNSAEKRAYYRQVAQIADLQAEVERLRAATELKTRELEAAVARLQAMPHVWPLAAKTAGLDGTGNSSTLETAKAEKAQHQTEQWQRSYGRSGINCSAIAAVDMSMTSAEMEYFVMEKRDQDLE